LLIRHVSPESPKKLTAPKAFRPAGASAISGALDRYLREQEEFLNFVRQSAGIDYNRVRLRSPVTPLVRYSLADAFVVIVVHAQRHLQQARRVRATSGFPG
jgi:nucleoid-associated protein YejK